jgi:phosphocarrier protein
MPMREFTIINKLGLHARAAAKLVSLTSRFKAEVTISKAGQTINGKSIMGVMMLAASKGTQLSFDALGEDAEALLDAIEELVNNRFGEDE